MKKEKKGARKYLLLELRENIYRTELHCKNKEDMKKKNKHKKPILLYPIKKCIFCI
jgi:hypothetical protein